MRMTRKEISKDDNSYENENENVDVDVDENEFDFCWGAEPG